MADEAKQKKKNKLSFLMDEEEGEVSDNSDCEIEVKRKRDLAFINEWSEKVKHQKSESKKEECTMDLESETEESKIDVKPIAMTVTFRDESFARKHRGVIETQMVMKYGPENVDSNSNCIFISPYKSSNDIINNVIVPLGALTIVFHDEDFSNENYDYILNFCKELFGSSKVTSDKYVIEVVQNDLLDFDVDTSRFGAGEILYVKPNDGCIPDEKPGRNQRARVANCFNCGGNHNLNSCRERRNYAIINENREKFQNNKMKSNVRYHAETDKFSGFGPGYLSENLRHALGLNSKQLPRHIYEMRKVGYPPAWLLEAKVAHSGVSVYGSKGAVPEEGDEEGEVFEEGEKDRYDIKKIIQFQGFNVPPPAYFIDEYERFECPAMNEDNDMSEMIRRLAPSAYQAYKKKRAMTLEALAEKDCPNAEIDSPSHLSENTSTPVSPSTPLPEETETSVTPKQKPRQTSINLGTPVLPSSSPFSKLPDRNKFGVNISDVINFENLPNSTGTYEKVSNSIAKIRVFVAQNSTE